MKIRLLICAAALYFVQETFAVKKAMDHEIEAIRTQMKTAAMMDQVIKKAEKDWNDAKNDPNMSGYDITRLEWARDREIDKQRAARTKAIHMTLQAYDLWPPSRSGTSVAPMTKGRDITWMPLARGPESRLVRDRNGKSYDLPQPTKKHSGVTYHDGVTYLTQEAFLLGPGYLAMVLLHERVHFEQNITPGKGDAMSQAEADVEAYGMEVNGKQGEEKIMDLLLDPKMKGYAEIVAKIKSDLAENEAIVLEAKKPPKNLYERVRRGLAPSGPPNMYQRRLHSTEELETIKAESDSLEAIVAEELETARRGREKLEAARREEARRAEVLREESAGRECLAHLRAAAESACAHGWIDRTAMNGPMLPVGNFYCLNRVKTLSGLDSCPSHINSMILGQLCDGGPFDPDPINEEIRTVYGPRVGPVLLVPGTERNTRLEPVEASGPPGSRPASDPSPEDDREPERERGGNRVEDGSSRARDQAGKIGRTGKWPR